MKHATVLSRTILICSRAAALSARCQRSEVAFSRTGILQPGRNRHQVNSAPAVLSVHHSRSRLKRTIAVSEAFLPALTVSAVHCQRSGLAQSRIGIDPGRLTVAAPCRSIINAVDSSGRLQAQRRSRSDRSIIGDLALVPAEWNRCWSHRRSRSHSSIVKEARSLSAETDSYMVTKAFTVLSRERRRSEVLSSRIGNAFPVSPAFVVFLSSAHRRRLLQDKESIHVDSAVAALSVHC